MHTTQCAAGWCVRVRKCDRRVWPLTSTRRPPVFLSVLHLFFSLDVFSGLSSVQREPGTDREQVKKNNVSLFDCEIFLAYCFSETVSKNRTGEKFEYTFVCFFLILAFLPLDFSTVHVLSMQWTWSSSTVYKCKSSLVSFHIPVVPVVFYGIT